MSIGFIGAGTISKTIDISAGGATRSVDTSLQNVLNKYDKIRTDIDRLKDQSQFNTYDITSRQYYNAYNKEAVNGWAETWYAEYRAVLSLRADALQKKLQAAYNRVLDRSIYAEMKADQESVFAPYANRTFKDTEEKNLSNKMPISSVLLSDLPISSTGSTTVDPNYTLQWSNGAIMDYLDSETGSGVFPPIRDNPPPGGGDPYTAYPATVRTDYVKYHSPSATTAGPTDFPDFPPIPVPPATVVVYNPTARNAQKAQVLAAITAGTAGMPVSTAEERAKRDAAVEAGLQAADELWKSGITTDGDDPDTSPDDIRDMIPPSQFYSTVLGVVNSISNPPGGATPANPGNTGIEDPDLPADYKNAYLPPVGDYKGTGGGNFMVNVPMFGMGDLLGLLAQNNVSPEVIDTMGSDTLVNMLATINSEIKRATTTFTGIQYDNIYQGNQYDAKTMATSLAVIPYATGSDTQIFTPMNTADDIKQGGSINSAGHGGLAGPTPVPGVKSIQLTTVPVPLFLSLGAQVTLGPDIFYGHQSAISNLSSAKGSIELPTIGLGSASFAIGLGVGTGGQGPQVGVIMNMSTSYDLFADAFEQILRQLKPLIVEAMTVNSYAASSGSAMDSYASRAEYHFTRPGFLESVQALNIKIAGIPFPIGKLIVQGITKGLPLVGSLGVNELLGLGTLSDTLADETTVNGETVADRLFKYKHSVQGAESRETETGAFFATNAFLSQFEMNSMESTYWVGTQQNEELVDMDMARSLLTAGPELIKALMASMNIALVTGGDTNPVANAAFAAILSGIQDAELLNIMYDLMYRDQKGTGSSKDRGNAVGRVELGIIGSRNSIQKSSIATEAYDYIENDHKPFQGDSDFNYTQSGLFSIIPGVGSIMDKLFAANKPDFILDGVANTLRFTNTTFDKDVKLSDVLAGASHQSDPTGLGPRGHAGRGGKEGVPDGSIWQDTPTGDINEVYTATRTVKFSNLTMGFDEFTNTSVTTGSALIKEGNEKTSADSELDANRETSAKVVRYVGSDSRINEARYTGANPVNHETFTSNLYTSANGREQYDRRNQYSMSFSTKSDSNNKINLFGSQALNPTIGGFIKMGEVDKNKLDTVAVMHSGTYKRISDGKIFYEKPTDYDATKYTYTDGMNAVRALGNAANDSQVQKFGGSVDGQLNELNQTLYDHLHLRVDGSNLDLVKEYRDVFETGLMKSIFINGQSYHPSGGGITSAIEIRYDTSKGRDVVQGAGTVSGEEYIKTREFYDAASSNFDPYNTPFLTRSRGLATVFLNNYFSYKKRAANTKT